MSYRKELIQELNRLDRVQLNYLAYKLDVENPINYNTNKLIKTILTNCTEGDIRKYLRELPSRNKIKFIKWWRKSNIHIYGIATIISTLIAIASIRLLCSPSPVILQENPKPIPIAVKIVDGSGRIISSANTRLLKYVLYKEDKLMQWQELETVRASDEEYTLLSAAEPGVYDIEAYDCGIFLGTAANITASDERVEVTIKALKRRHVEVIIQEPFDKKSYSLKVEILNYNAQDRIIVTQDINKSGKAEFYLWPTNNSNASYTIRIMTNGREVFKIPIVEIEQGEQPMIIPVKLNSKMIEEKKD